MGLLRGLPLASSKMKKQYKNISILLIVLLPAIALAHTFSWEKVKCPVDGEKFTFTMTGSMITTGNSYADLELYATMGNHYGNMIHSCPQCHYSGFLSDFKIRFPRKVRKRLKAHLTQYDSLTITDIVECQIAGEIKHILNSDFSEIAHCYLIGSYLLRYKPQRQDLRKNLQQNAKKYYMASYYSFGCEDLSDSAVTTYLIAEMFRRTSSFDQSITYYDLAILYSQPDSRINQYAVKQKKVALEGNDANNM
jgi:uncharacterized protein (DUF2225 family)